MKKFFYILYLFLIFFVLIFLYSISQDIDSKKNSNENLISICSWNLEKFGEKKLSNKIILKQISEIILMCDIIALQEIQNLYEKADENCTRNRNAKFHKNFRKIQNTFEKFIGKNYEIIISPQTKDERFIYIFNKNKIEIENFYLANDKHESGEICAFKKENFGGIVRNPFVANFKVKNSSFDFKLIQVHTSPENNKKDLTSLYEIFLEEEKKQEKDIIILGDLNLDCSYFKKEWNLKIQSKKFILLNTTTKDTTTKFSTCEYDRFIITNNTEKYFSQKLFTLKTNTKVSDHLPIKAYFYKNKDTN